MLNIIVTRLLYKYIYLKQIKKIFKAAKNHDLKKTKLFFRFKFDFYQL